MSLRRVVTILLLTALLVGAGFNFGRVCGRMEQAHLLLLPYAPDLLRLFGWLLLSLGLLAVTAGAVACLFRPTWVACVAFLLCGVAILLGWDISATTALLALALVLVGMLYTYRVQAELRKRLEFSVGVVGEPQRLLLIALLAIALFGFYLGYQQHIETRGFGIPDEYVNRIVDDASDQVTLAVPEMLRASLRSVIREQLQRLLQDQLTRVAERVERYVPAAVTLLLLLLFLTAIQLLGWLPIVALGGMLLVLRLTGLLQTVTETREVKRLVIA